MLIESAIFIVWPIPFQFSVSAHGAENVDLFKTGPGTIFFCGFSLHIANYCAYVIELERRYQIQGQTVMPLYSSMH